jgi:predicted HicB family RNase H-like nuclease
MTLLDHIFKPIKKLTISDKSKKHIREKIKEFNKSQEVIMSEKKTTTIRIPEDLRDQIKHKVIDLKISFNEFILQAIKDKLAKK